MIITFTKAYPPYNAGERAEFDEATAGRLIDAGVAEATDDVPAAADKAPAATDKEPAAERSARRK
jgi:hypothetical protein